MNIRQLKIFKVVAEQESITEASKILYISQPAVSTTITELEDTLGVNLFDRVSRRIYLNETGKIFLVKVTHLLEEFENLEKDVLELEDKAPIRIGSSITIAMSSLNKVIKQFNREYPNTKVIVTVKNAEDIENILLKNEIDLGLVEGIVRSDDFESEIISKYPLSVVTYPEHPLAIKNNLEIKDLIYQDFLLREKGSAIRDIFDSAMLLKNIHIEPLWRSINSQVLINAVKQGLGITVLPNQLIKREIKDGSLVKLNIKDLDLVNSNSIIRNKDKVLSEKMKRFIEILKDL